MSYDEHYLPLLAEDPEKAVDTSSEDVKARGVQRGGIFSRKRLRTLLYWGLLALQSFALIVLLTRQRSVTRACEGQEDLSQTYYSPAEEALQYERVTFSMGVGSHTTIYQDEPSEAVDRAWYDLYNDFGVSKISKAQADLLPNKTVAIPGEDGYIAGLSVFHQLHCLNVIRRSLRPDYYADPITGAIAGIMPNKLSEHISHCIDDLRQSAMCSADISVIVWQENGDNNTTAQASPRMDSAHTCRNFTRIVDWAKGHKSGVKPE
ncbi:unnamed protein product [Somion occarium]|uniref:Uncharacterized protein n=1 Tax=Somion occarium TaxID=3059160 RepID=A0ABP1DW73_9APHY